MHIVLWVLQVILAGKLLASVYSHALRPDPNKMQRGLRRLGAAARPLLIVSGLGMLLGAAGLVLPGALGFWPWLTPWTAAAAAVLMLVGAGLHLGCRDKPNAWVGLILFVLAALVAVGRWVLAPLL
jgi:hypothetical protein